MAARSLVRANVAVAAGTLASRITGLIRFALLVYVLDRSLADSYNTANNIPNVVYELILGGVLTATLVPLFTEQADKGDAEGTSAVVTTSAIVLLALTAVATALAPLIVRLYTLNSADVDAAHLRSVTTTFALVFLPQIFFYGVTFLASALLNARHRFFAAAWVPVLNNLVVIGALAAIPTLVPEHPRDLALASRSAELRLVLAWSTTAGIIATAAVLVPVLRRAGVKLRWRPDWHHPAVRRVVRMSGWTIGYVAANQVSLYAMTVLAKPGSGGVTSYQAAFLLFQMPVGLLAVSIMTTFTPDLALARLRRDKAALLGRVSLGLRSLALVTLPAAAALVALARPVVGLVLEHGFFGEASADETAGALAAFALGLFALSAYLFVLRTFYAHNDTKTPFVVNVIENALNVVFGVILANRYGVPGLAWSFTLAYVVSAVFALIVLDIKLKGAHLGTIVVGLARLVIAAVVAAEVAWLVSDTVGGNAGAKAVVSVGLGGLVTVGVYVGLLAFLQAPEIQELRRLQSRRRRGATAR